MLNLTQRSLRILFLDLADISAQFAYIGQSLAMFTQHLAQHLAQSCDFKLFPGAAKIILDLVSFLV